MDHKDFARLYQAGEVGLDMADATARSLVEDHPAMPARYRSAHTFWAWVWMLTGLATCGLLPLLFGLRPAINRSARQFVAEFAVENAAFYEEGVARSWFRVVKR